MSIQSDARAVLTEVAALMPSAAVAVIIGGQSATGIREQSLASAEGSDMGEQGLTTGTLYVSQAAVSEPAKGATITIAGAKALVLAVDPDPAGATYRIDYQLTRPVEGV